jgi:ABC-type multidrug transport system fused ATPase/permease subunit
MIWKLLISDFAKDHIWKFIVYIILILVFFPIEAIALPKVYGKMFDQVKSISKFSDIFNWTDNFKKMNFQGSLVILVILWFLVICSYTAKNFIETHLVPDYYSHIRDVIFKETILTYQNDYQDMKTGEYLARVLELTRNFKDVVHHILSRFLPELIVSILIICYMFYQNKYIGSVLLIGVVLCGIILYFGSKELIELISERENFLNTNISENIRDTLDNLMNVFLNNEVDSEISKNQKLEKIAIDKLKWIMMVQNMVIFSSQLITLLTFSIGIFILYSLIAAKKIKTTQGIVLVIILGQFLNNFLYVSSGFIHNVVYRLGIIEASKEYLEHIFNRKNKRNLKTGITDGNIIFKNVKFRYDTEKEDMLFQDLNVQFDAGERYAIVGQSGGGKTTMMKMVAGLYVPESGSIYIDNLDIKHADLEYLRENVNYFNQRTTLFNETILYNMLYGNPDSTEEQVVAILEKYDLLKMFNSLPDGIHANAGIQGGNLSGGMQRVTMLIRGLLKPGQIIIMDEPTSGLDKESTDKVKKLIFEETEGKTLIIITHSSVLLSSMRVLDIENLKGE